jgi:hypothetical protein
MMEANRGTSEPSGTPDTPGAGGAGQPSDINLPDVEQHWVIEVADFEFSSAPKANEILTFVDFSSDTGSNGQSGIGDGTARSPHFVTAESPATKLKKRYKASYYWLLYGTPAKRPSSPGTEPKLPSPPGTERYFIDLVGLPNGQVRACALLLHREYRVGVLSIWTGPWDGPTPTPLEHKKNSPVSYPEIRETLERIGIGGIGERERMYPFLAVWVNSEDIARYVAKNYKQVGRLLTGGDEFEEPAQLRSYVKENLSWRSYERLYLRWTDALGLYGENIDPETRENTIANTIARAVQLYEICVLVRRILRSASSEITKLSTGLTALHPRSYARWRRSNAVLTKFTDTELNYLVAPPVRSVEGEVLLKRAYQHFGLPDLVDATRQNYTALERRLQWIKAQWLGAVAVLAFILDKLAGRWF